MPLRHSVRVALTVTAVSLLTGAVAVAESPTIYQSTLGEEGAKTSEVSTQQLRDDPAKGKSIVIDTRSRAEFEAGHIPGAVNLGVAGDEQVRAVEKLVGGNKAKDLILYGNGPSCRARRNGARENALQ